MANTVPFYLFQGIARTNLLDAGASFEASPLVRTLCLLLNHSKAPMGCPTQIPRSRRPGVVIRRWGAIRQMVYPQYRKKRSHADIVARRPTSIDSGQLTD